MSEGTEVWHIVRIVSHLVWVWRRRALRIHPRNAAWARILEGFLGEKFDFHSVDGEIIEEC